MRRHRVSALWALCLSFLLFVLLLPPRVGAESVPGESSADPTSAAESAPAETPLPILASGARGDDVVRLQTRLDELGYRPGSIDGIFGSGTRKAVVAFQKRNGLQADGSAGPQTLALLYSSDAVPAEAEPDPVDVLAGDLPMLVNSDHPVGEFFLPDDLISLNDFCDTSLVKIKYKNTLAVRAAAEALVTMLEAAREDGITKWQISAAYRSYDKQVSTLNSKINYYLSKNSGWSRSRARKAALKTVAEPGASEHHTGLALDINVPGASSFRGTKQSAWLNEHCWEYGFIIRYPEDKVKITGISYEPWHIRYVGRDFALDIRDSGLCLEEYLDALANGTLEAPRRTVEESISLDEEEDLI